MQNNPIKSDLNFILNGSNVTNGKALAAATGLLYNLCHSERVDTRSIKILIQYLARLMAENKKYILKRITTDNQYKFINKAEEKIYEFPNAGLAAHLEGRSIPPHSIHIYSHSPISIIWSFKKTTAVKKDIIGISLSKGKGLMLIARPMKFCLTGKVDAMMSEQEKIRHIQCNARLHCGVLEGDEYLSINNLSGKDMVEPALLLYKSIKFLVYPDYLDEFSSFEHNRLKKGLNEYFPKAKHKLNIPVQDRSLASFSLLLKKSLK